MWTRLQPPTHAVFMLPVHCPASHGGQRDSVQGSGQRPIIQNHKEFQEQIKMQFIRTRCGPRSKMLCNESDGMPSSEALLPGVRTGSETGRRPACGQAAGELQPR